MMKFLSTFCCVSLVMGCFFSCDVFEPDADVISPDIHLSDEQIFAYSNNATFIDLKSKIKTNRPVRFRVTTPTSSGVLTDLGLGLLQYTPVKEKRATSDSFEFTILSERDEVIKRDTVFINIETDSTHLPCGIFPADDYVYGVQRNTPVLISVLANDYLCGVDSSNLVVSVLSGDNFPPHYGAVEMAGRAVVYTAGSQFAENDSFIYKVHPNGQPDKSVYGIVYLSGKTNCGSFTLRDDIFSFGADTLRRGVALRVLANDSLCQSPDRYQWHVAEAPRHGVVNVSDDGFTYKLPAEVPVGPAFSDAFHYEVCIGNQCKTARVEVRAAGGIACDFYANPDSAMVTGSTPSLFYIDVLANDKICDGYDTIEITSEPEHGSAYFSTEFQAIAYQQSVVKSDSLEYEICKSAKCARAKVYIRRE